MIHCYGRSEGVAGVIITKEYPTIAAHSVLSKLMDQFLAEKPLASINAAKTNDSIPFPPLKDFIRDYQDPNKASSIAKIQQELDETKIVLHKAIDSVCCETPVVSMIYHWVREIDANPRLLQVLQRGEKLDDLVAKSSDLSAQSKMFYKSAKKQNSCCILM